MDFRLISTTIEEYENSNSWMNYLDELELAILVGHLAGPVFLLTGVSFGLQGPSVKGNWQDHGKETSAERLASGLEVLIV